MFAIVRVHSISTAPAEILLSSISIGIHWFQGAIMPFKVLFAVTGVKLSDDNAGQCIAPWLDVHSSVIQSDCRSLEAPVRQLRQGQRRPLRRTRLKVLGDHYRKPRNVNSTCTCVNLKKMVLNLTFRVLNETLLGRSESEIVRQPLQPLSS